MKIRKSHKYGLCGIMRGFQVPPLGILRIPQVAAFAVPEVFSYQNTVFTSKHKNNSFLLAFT